MDPAVQCSKGNSGVTDSPCPQPCKHWKDPYKGVKSHYLEPRPLSSCCQSQSKHLSESENPTHHQLSQARRTWKRRKPRLHITQQPQHGTLPANPYLGRCCSSPRTLPCTSTSQWAPAIPPQHCSASSALHRSLSG